jgi:hypothetical protein
VILARVMTATGRPWDELEDTLTWPRLNALGRYWQDNPPVHELVAVIAEAAFGIKPKQSGTQGAGLSSLEEIISLFEGGVMK